MNKKELLMNDLVAAVNGVLEWHDENFSDGVNREYSIKVLRDALQSFQQCVQADGDCTCANRHIGEDHICVNCGGVA